MADAEKIILSDECLNVYDDDERARMLGRHCIILMARGLPFGFVRNDDDKTWTITEVK